MTRRTMLLALATPALQPEQETPPALEAFTIDDLERPRAEEERAYLPFLRRPTLHCGIYALSAGAEDRQQPHEEDEVYHVLEGRARLTVEGDGGGTVDVVAGAVLFVAAGASHRFHDIEEDLKLLVFFSRATRDERR